ncbi:thioredoxin family protein [Candidatus Sumerlaeota bacterium]|nr:thioredoxin family protein [Candidatus Sumerlaeota bacterium]
MKKILVLLTVLILLVPVVHITYVKVFGEEGIDWSRVLTGGEPNGEVESSASESHHSSAGRNIAKGRPANGDDPDSDDESSDQEDSSGEYSVTIRPYTETDSSDSDESTEEQNDAGAAPVQPLDAPTRNQRGTPPENESADQTEEDSANSRDDARQPFLREDPRAGRNSGNIERLTDVDIARDSVPGKVTLFDFYADWCPACRHAAPKIERLASQYPGLIVKEVDIVEWDSEIAQKYDIHTVPSFWIADRKGKIVQKNLNQFSDAETKVREMLD